MIGKQTDTEQKARERMAVILKVRGGQWTAKEGAKVLGLSRKSYYQIEKKALEGMMGALLPGRPGRPTTPRDPEKEALQSELEAKNKELLIAQAKREIRELLYGMEPGTGSSPMKPGKKKR